MRLPCCFSLDTSRQMAPVQSRRLIILGSEDVYPRITGNGNLMKRQPKCAGKDLLDDWRGGDHQVWPLIEPGCPQPVQQAPPEGTVKSLVDMMARGINVPLDLLERQAVPQIDLDSPPRAPEAQIHPKAVENIHTCAQLQPDALQAASVVGR